MSGYVRNTGFSIEFDGDVVKGSLSPLSLPDLLKMQAREAATDEDAAKILAEIVPAYVKTFVGPKDAAGVEVTIQEVCSTAYFLHLAMSIGRKLVEAAVPANPKQPSEPSAG